MTFRILTESDLAIGLEALLEIDPKLIPIARQVRNIPLRKSSADYKGLAKIITSQLISRAAADAIWQRFEDGLGNVNAKSIIACTEQDLRDLGQSGAKARTLLNLAEEELSGRLNFEEIYNLEIDKALKKLTSLKGIGLWTAEVYLLFCCGHRDLFPSGDVALRTAIGHAFFDGERPDAKSVDAYSNRWSPMRGIASRLMWSYYGELKGRKSMPI